MEKIKAFWATHKKKILIGLTVVVGLVVVIVKMKKK